VSQREPLADSPSSEVSADGDGGGLRSTRSITRGESGTPGHGAPDREEYLARGQRDCGWGSASRPIALLAYDTEGIGDCLLFDQACCKFALAYGHPASGEPLDLTGHSSNDAPFESLACALAVSYRRTHRWLA